MKDFHFIPLIAFSLMLASCSSKNYTTLSSLKSCNYRSIVDNKETELIRIKNDNKMELCVTNYGARIVSLMVPDKRGNLDDIVCGFDSIQSYINIKQNYGALVGRYIGRILGAKFYIDGKEYKLQAGGNGHCGHGGNPGFANRTWNVTSHKKNSVTLSYLSEDGENGFPGNLSISVSYTISNNNELIIDYKAKTDKPTVLNPSNHSFFNITGNLDKSICNQELWVDADSIAEYGEGKCVSGKMIAVKNTPFDFTKKHAIGDKIDEDNKQLNITGGYDHTWKLKNNGNINEVVSRIEDKTTGRIMEVYTTEPGLHIYTANGHRGNIRGKGNVVYPRRNSVCFETMHFADSPNKPQFPSTVLRPGDEFTSTTIFKFSNK